MNDVQIAITFGKYISGYRPGDEGWSELDQEVYDKVMGSKTVSEEWCKGYARKMIEEERKRVISALEKRYKQACKDQITDYDNFYSGVACGYDVALQIVEGEIEE